MKYRLLSKSGLKASILGLGCMGMSPGTFGQPDEVESINTLYKAIDLGINLFDTADMYGMGHNETFIGKILKPFRKQLILTTKCGIVCNPTGYTRNGSKKYIKKSCEESLKRLNTEVIDIYYLHRLDPAIPIEESMEAMVELVNEGKIRGIGLSEVNTEIIRRAYSVFPITAIQSEYSILFRQPAETILPVCNELKIAFIPFSPIGRGFLSGILSSIHQLELDDYRKCLPYLQDENIAHNLNFIHSMARIANQANVSIVQLALAWLLARGKQIIPIPGTTKVKHLLENVAAINIKLTVSQLAELDKIGFETPLKGERFPKELEEWFLKI